ncbi:MAG: hypothetical protein ACOCVN_01650 [bacterium]
MYNCPLFTQYNQINIYKNPPVTDKEVDLEYRDFSRNKKFEDARIITNTIFR